MSFVELISVGASHLIEIMGIVLIGALIVRYLAYKNGKSNQLYFNTFSKNIEKQLAKGGHTQSKEHVEAWISGLLESVVESLPERSLRSDQKLQPEGPNIPATSSSTFREGVVVESFEEYSDGKKSILHAIKQNIDVFKSPQKTNFSEYTDRVLRKDKKWNKLLGIVPVDTFSRLLDIMPGLFIVGGIFGTFIGITSALPQIALIDLNNLEEAAPILNRFVESVAFSMHTSIAGIVYSVVMTILNTTFPIATIRNSVKQNLEKSLESIWHSIHGERIAEGDKKIISLLEELVHQQKSKGNKVA